MNVFSNCIPNKYITFTDKDPPWMTNYLKYKIHCKNSLYLNYLKHGKKNCDYIELQRSIEEVSGAIFKSKEPYHDCLAKKLNNPKTSPKTYWAIMKTFYNSKKIPLIPPLIINDKLESDFGKKANHQTMEVPTSFRIKYTNSRTFFLSISWPGYIKNNKSTTCQ